MSKSLSSDKLNEKNSSKDAITNAVEEKIKSSCFIKAINEVINPVVKYVKSQYSTDTWEGLTSVSILEIYDNIYGTILMIFT